MAQPPGTGYNARSRPRRWFCCICGVPQLQVWKRAHNEGRFVRILGDGDAGGGGLYHGDAVPDAYPISDGNELPHVYPLPDGNELPHIYPLPDSNELPHEYPLPDGNELPHEYPLPDEYPLPYGDAAADLYAVSDAYSDTAPHAHAFCHSA